MIPRYHRRFFLVLGMVVLFLAVGAAASAEMSNQVFLPLLIIPFPTMNIFLPLSVVDPTATPTPTETPTPTPTPIPSPTPTPVHHWFNIGGVEVVGLAMNPLNPNEVFAGAWDNGFARSVDGGVSWELWNFGLGSLEVNSIGVDPTHPNNVYAGTYKHGIYRSSDGGATWKSANQGIQASAIVYTLTVDPSDSKRIYAGTRGISNNGAPPWKGVVYKTSDGGDTWKPVLNNVGGASAQDWVYSIAVNPNQPGMVLAATHEHGPYLSLDYGETWAPTSNGNLDGSGRGVAIDPRSAAAATFYYGVWHRSGVYKSINSGKSWSQEYINGVKIFSVVIDPINPDILYLATFSQGVMRSSNAGGTWGNDGLTTSQVYGVVVDPTNDQKLFASAALDGLWISSDHGITWKRPAFPPPGGTVSAILALEGSPQELIGSIYGGGLRLSTDAGLTWQDLAAGSGIKAGNDLLPDPLHTGWFYLLTDAAGLLHVDLKGDWQVIRDGLPVSGAQTGLAGSQALPAYVPANDPRHPFASREAILGEDEGDATLATSDVSPGAPLPLLAETFSPSDPHIAYLGTSGRGVYRSTDGGATWRTAGLDGLVVWSLAVDPHNAQTVYAAGHAPDGVWMSANGGETWASMGPVGNTAIYSVSVLEPARGEPAVFAGSGDGVWRYSGNRWVRSGLEGQVVTVLAVPADSQGVLYAGTTDGAFVSHNAGQSWERGPAELAGMTIRSIHFDPNDPGVVYYGTLNHGAFRGN